MHDKARYYLQDDNKVIIIGENGVETQWVVALDGKTLHRVDKPELGMRHAHYEGGPAFTLANSFVGQLVVWLGLR